MKRYMKILPAMALCMAAAGAKAQDDRTPALNRSEHNGWEYEVRAGVNIGGALPLPMPREIRRINSFSPKFNGTVEGTVTKWLGNTRTWGVSAGLRVEEKGMKTGSRVKNYATEIFYEGSRVAGRWTGDVETDYNSTLLTLPVMANYRFDSRLKVRAGLYVSYRMDGEFSGVATNGYLREGSPTGEKIEFAEGRTAAFNFDGDLRRVLYGVQIGGTWRAFRHFTVNADLTWNANSIFRKEFKTITTGLYPVYLNMGFGYRF